MSELLPHLRAYRDEICERIASGSGRRFLIVCEPESAKFLGEHLPAEALARASILDEGATPHDFMPEPDQTVIVTHADRWVAHAIYRRLGAAKAAGRVVTLALRDRRLQMHPPGWSETGIHYEGMFRLAATYCWHHHPRGSYAEFGVFDGNTFAVAWHALNGVCDKFFAYDSFAGIIGAMVEETGTYKDGDYFANLETFKANMELARVDLGQVAAIRGPFQDTLTRTPEDHGLAAVSIAHIDVDVYEPAKLALDYLSPVLQQGALLLFDDYDQMGAANDLGERRAVREWLAENPSFSVEPYRNYGIFGRSFIFHREG